MKVLLVDDDPILRKVLGDILKMRGIESVPVETGAEALSRIEQPDIDVALIDLKLEDSSGLEVLRGIQQRSPGTECILLTGYASQTSAIEAINLGAYAYFQKPYDVEQLLVAIQNAAEKRAAGETLKKSEERYRLLAENMSDTIWLMDMNLKNVYISPSVVNLRGYTLEELNELPLDQQMMPESLARAMRVFADALSPERLAQPDQPITITAELEFYKKDGSTFWSENTFVLIRDADGTPVNILGSGHDITERKQTEEKLRKSEALFASLFHANPTRISITRFEDSRFLDVNETFLKSIGYTREEVVDHTSSELNDWVDPQERIRLRNLLKDQGKVKDFETQLRKKSGDIMDILISAERIELFGQACILSVGLDITERKQAEEALHKHLTELELLYQSGLALSSLLNPQEIGQKILELLEQKLDWHHTTIRLYNPQDETLELLAFRQPGLEGEAEKRATAERFNMQVGRIEDGLTGWAVQQSRTIRSGDVANDPHYKETFPGLHSGLYIPIKLGERIVGVISIESEAPNAFTEADERLLDTLANQAASALENARLFKETRQRLVELETVNRVSIALRVISKQDEMLAIVLEETLSALNASDGSINLLNNATGKLHKTIARGWPSEFSEMPVQPGEGIFGSVFASGNPHISRDFASDPLTRPESSGQLPTGWGGACVPIRATEQTLGVMLVAIPGGRELNREQIRLLDTLAEMTGNALQRSNLHEQTAHRLNQLESLRVVDRAIAGSLDRRITLNILLDQVISQLGVDAADVLILNFPLQTLQFTAGQGFRTGLNETVSVRVGESFAGRAVIEHRLVRVEDRETASGNQSFLAFWQNEGFSNYYAVPLITKGQVKGVLEVFHRSPFTPDSEWINFLEALADQTAIAIDSAQLFENLHSANLELTLAYDATIEGWSRAMDLRDKETEGHTQRVTKMATDLAQAFGLNDQEIIHIRRGALLHDIGKMGVPDHILLKPGKLVDVEWALMQKHPQLAYDMLQPIQYLRESLDIPYCHHEKWDGTGYPQGLKGEQIPLAARIFAIVDVYDALTSDRPYRSAWPKAKTIKYIRELSGLQFDPRVMKKFMELLGNKKG
jgi:PAS domain S-box-containing protein